MRAPIQHTHIQSCSNIIIILSSAHHTTTTTTTTTTTAVSMWDDPDFPGDRQDLINYIKSSDGYMADEGQGMS